MAATRTLGRTRLDKALVERCQQHDIRNCGQLLSCSVPELVQRQSEKVGLPRSVKHLHQEQMVRELLAVPPQTVPVLG